MADKILIVDDDLESLKLIGLMLQRRGYQITAAQGGAQAGGHATRDELQLLVVHGILHLLGHDHAGPDEKARKAKLRLDTREGLLAGGKSGDPAAIPGKKAPVLITEARFGLFESFALMRRWSG